MTAGTSRADRRFGGASRPDTAVGAGSRARFAALAALSCGALAIATAPLLPVVSTSQGPPPAAGFLAWPLLGALALIPAVAAVGLARSAPAVTAGLMLGLAALAPGRALLDVQLIADAGLAARPELVVATSLAPLHPGPGLALLLAGHLLTALAGVLVLTARAPDADREGSCAPTAGEGVGEELTGRGTPRQGLLLAALGLGVVASVGLLAPPFHSTTGFLLARWAFDGPGWALAGAMLLAVLVPTVACLLAASTSRGRARGGLLGLAAGVAAVAAPALAAGLFGTDLTPAPGPVAALTAAAGLALLAGPAGHALTRDSSADQPDLILPAAERLYRLAGATALLAGALATAGVLAPALQVPAGTAEPVLNHARLLAPAAVVLTVLGVALLFSARVGAVTRPVLSVAWVVGPLAATAILDPVLTASDVPGVRLGLGSWCAAAVLVVAAAAGLCAAVAGGVERDDVDLSALAQRGTDRPLLAAGVGAALLAVPAFALPLAQAQGHQLMAIAPGVSGTQLSAWGLLTGLVAVLLATLIAPRCRPIRAVALLVGAGAVVIVRLAELPLVAARLDGAVLSVGTWFSLGVLVLLVIGIGLAMRPSTW